MSASPPTQHPGRRVSEPEDALKPTPTARMTDLETKISLCEEIFKAWKGEIRLSIAEIDTNVKEIQRDFEGFCEINAKNEKKTDEIVGNATRFLSNFQANPQVITK